ncbi:hypothetical protein ACFVGY_03210 [Streptomyces sp. NPDC127106]
MSRSAPVTCGLFQGVADLRRRNRAELPCDGSSTSRAGRPSYPHAEEPP